MLATQGMTVGEVADALGFKSASAFSRFFSTKLGMSPSKMRQISGRPGDTEHF
jgi:AraC-like DNA-binding protein